MDVVAGALPTRPLKVTPVASSGQWMILLMGLAALAFVPFLVLMDGKRLVADFMAPSDLRPANDLRVSEARCRSRAFLFTTCDIKVADARGNKVDSFDYMLLRSDLPERVSVLRSASQPAYLTTNLGQETKIGRAMMQVLMLTLFGGAGIAIPLLWWRQRQAAATFPLLSGQPLEAGFVTLETVGVGKTATTYTYHWRENGKKRRLSARWKNEHQPFVIGGNPARTIAVRAKAGSAAMLIDQNFSSLDLSEPERAAFLSAMNEHLGAATTPHAAPSSAAPRA